MVSTNPLYGNVDLPTTTTTSSPPQQESSDAAMVEWPLKCRYIEEASLTGSSASSIQPPSVPMMEASTGLEHDRQRQREAFGSGQLMMNTTYPFNGMALYCQDDIHYSPIPNQPLPFANYPLAGPDYQRYGLQPMQQHANPLPPAMTMSPPLQYMTGLPGLLRVATDNNLTYPKPEADDGQPGVNVLHQGRKLHDEPAGFTPTTRVDTLMRTIQAKTVRPRTQECASPISVGFSRGTDAAYNHDSLNGSREWDPRSGSCSNDKKKYACDWPSCDKRFFQKTHLGIHQRSHNGSKPFVS